MKDYPRDSMTGKCFRARRKADKHPHKQGGRVRKSAQRARDTYRKNIARRTYDPDTPCDECGSTCHQLADHPNPNTPEGYLEGCPHCNTKGHSFAQCRRFKGDKTVALYRYFRVKREGLCPGEYNGDPREIPDFYGNYTLNCLPLRPRDDWKYPNEKDFISVADGGDKALLLQDPFWHFESKSAWKNLGRYANLQARASEEELKKWAADEHTRVLSIRANLIHQSKSYDRWAPTDEQLDSFCDFVGKVPREDLSQHIHEDETVLPMSPNQPEDSETMQR